MQYINTLRVLAYSKEENLPDLKKSMNLWVRNAHRVFHRLTIFKSSDSLEKSRNIENTKRNHTGLFLSQQ
jgi:hypothetical protein